MTMMPGHELSERTEVRRLMVWSSVICLPPLAFLIWDLIAHRYYMSSSLSLQIQAVDLIIKGKEPYVDFWDWTQPLVYDSIKVLYSTRNAFKALLDFCQPFLAPGFVDSVEQVLFPDVFITICLFAVVVGSILFTAAIAGYALDWTYSRQVGDEDEILSALSVEDEISQSEKDEAARAYEARERLDDAVPVQARIEESSVTSFPSASEDEKEKTVIRKEINDTILPYLLAIATASVVIRFDFADLQHLFLIGIFPWIFYRWLRYKGVSFPFWTSLVVGLSAGVVSCFDLPYLPMILVVEFALFFYQRNVKAFKGVDVVAFTTVIVLNLVRLLMLEEAVRVAYWQWTMPLKWINYVITNPQLFGPASCPNRSDVFYTVAFTGLLSLIFFNKNGLVAAISLLSIMGLALSAYEGQGFSADLIIVIFTATIIIALTVAKLFRGFIDLAVSQGVAKSPDLAFKVSLIIASIAAVVPLAISLDRDRMACLSAGSQAKAKFGATLEEAIWENSKPGDEVIVLCDHTHGAYPVLLFLGRNPGSYFLWTRPLRLLHDTKKALGKDLTPAMIEFRDFFANSLRGDLKRRKASLVLLSDDLIQEAVGNRLVPWIEENYDLVGGCGLASSRNRQPHEHLTNTGFRIYRRKERN